MRKVFIILLIIVIAFVALAYRKHRLRHFSTSRFTTSDVVTKLTEEVKSKEEALKYFSEWLREETNYSDKDNGIDSIVKYRGYYEIRLKTSIIINGTTPDSIGYMYYVVTKDGYLNGYLYSK